LAPIHPPLVTFSGPSGGDLAPELDLAGGAVVASNTPTIIEPTVGASSSQMPSGAATPKTAPEVDMTTTTDAVGTTGSKVPNVLPMGDVTYVGGGGATIGDGDSDELKVVMGHPGL
jgi:hypothetical protein